MSNRIWITWEIQRRNRSMSKMLNASLHELVLEAPAWRRYPLLLARTVKLIVKTRPEVVFSQNPSLVLAGISVLTCRLLGIPVIIDAHNAGLFPIEGKSSLLNRIARFVNNHANSVIVSNSTLKTYVENSGGNALVVADPVPDINCVQKRPLPDDRFNIVFVCSWAEDEPYKEVIEMAAEMNKQVRIYMTGNSKGRATDDAVLPENVVLTGFLDNTEYEAIICSCDAVMVLTTRDDCLVCGAYEGVAVEKPLILSNTVALKEFFYKGCIYADNTKDGLVSAVTSLLSMHDELKIDAGQLKLKLKEKVADQILDMEDSVLKNYAAV